MGSHWLQMALIWTLGSECRASRAPIFNPKEVTILSIFSLSLWEKMRQRRHNRYEWVAKKISLIFFSLCTLLFQKWLKISKRTLTSRRLSKLYANTFSFRTLHRVQFYNLLKQAVSIGAALQRNANTDSAHMVNKFTKPAFFCTYTGWVFPKFLICLLPPHHCFFELCLHKARPITSLKPLLSTPQQAAVPVLPFL